MSQAIYIIILQIVQNLLTEKYRDNFNVCLSLHLLKYFKVDKSNVFSILESRLSVSEFFAKCMLFSIDRYGAHKYVLINVNISIHQFLNHLFLTELNGILLNMFVHWIIFL